MKTRFFLLVTTILLLGQLISCSTKKPQIAITDQDFNNQQDLSKAEEQLSEAAKSVSESLSELAAINRAIHPQAKMPDPVEPNKIGITQIGSIDWNGPVGPLVKKIAEATNYKLKVLGSQPAVPILVSITAKNTLLADILRDAEFQCGNRANIVVYPKSKIIELRYNRSKST